MRDSIKVCLIFILFFGSGYIFFSQLYQSYDTKMMFRLSQVANLPTGEVCKELLGKPMADGGNAYKKFPVDEYKYKVYVWPGSMTHMIGVIIDRKTDAVVGVTYIWT